jgi:hypothetical protein
MRFQDIEEVAHTQSLQHTEVRDRVEKRDFHDPTDGETFRQALTFGLTGPRASCSHWRGNTQASQPSAGTARIQLVSPAAAARCSVAWLHQSELSI